MTETLVPARRIELMHTIPVQQDNRDKAIKAVCGEILAALETRKADLRGKLDQLRKELTGVEDGLKKAGDAFGKRPTRFFTADIADLKALARKFKWGELTFNAEVTVGNAKIADAELEVKGKENGNYRDGLAIKRSVALTPELLALTGKKEALNRQICEINIELAKTENNIAKMPQNRMLVEASVARHDLEQDEAGRELYAAVRSSFRRFIPAELRQMLSA